MIFVKNLCHTIKIFTLFISQMRLKTKIMNIKPYPLIVFDMDGTLIDSLPDIDRSCQTLLKSYGLPPINTQSVRSTLGDGIKVTVEKILDNAGKEASFIDRNEAIERFIKDYVPHAADLSKPFERAEEVLIKFKKNGWKIALCSNKITQAAKNILEKLNLQSYFDFIAGGDCFADKKPYPVHLLGIINYLQVLPTKTVMVGDHLNDIHVARNAHITGSIFAEWGYGDLCIGKEATMRARSIKDVPIIAEKMIDKKP